MRIDAGSRTWRVLLGASLLVAVGCTGIHRIDLGPDGGSRSDRELRDLVARGRFEAALSRVAPDGSSEVGDELLRLLQHGIIAHYAGDYDASNASFERALLLIEDRYTKSLTRAIVSLVTSDRLLAWIPSRSERALLHYYAALNYLALEEPEEAAVEARRLAHLLALTEDEVQGRSEKRLRRFLHYFTGAVFETAGEIEDAAVAYRIAAVETRGVERAAERRRDDSDNEAGGDVVVFLESGFVAHRVEQSINVLLFPEELAAFGHERAQIRYAAARCVASRAFGDVSPAVFAGLGETARWSRGSDGRCLVEGVDTRPVRKRGDRGSDDGDDHDGDDHDGDGAATPWFLRIAWPAMRRTGPAPPSVRVRSDDGGSVPPDLDADLSASVIDEFEDDLGGVLVKALARAATKYAAARGIEESLGGSDEVLGRLAGMAANAAGALLERADLRSWHLAPSSFAVVRLRLPPGRHSLTVVLESGSGGPGREVRLADVEVRAGRVTVAAARLWPGSVGSVSSAR